MRTSTAPPPSSPSKPWTLAMSPSSSDLRASSTVVTIETSPWAGIDVIITIKVDDSSDIVTFMFESPSTFPLFFNIFFNSWVYFRFWCFRVFFSSLNVFKPTNCSSFTTTFFNFNQFRVLSPVFAPMNSSSLAHLSTSVSFLSGKSTMDVTFTHVTMESDKYICVRETTPQNSVWTLTPEFYRLKVTNHSHFRLFALYDFNSPFLTMMKQGSTNNQ